MYVKLKCRVALVEAFLKLNASTAHCIALGCLLVGRWGKPERWSHLTYTLHAESVVRFNIWQG